MKIANSTMTMSIDKEGNWGVINPTYQAVYEVRNLSGATYQVIAAEDIYTGDGTLRVAAGTVVADIGCICIGFRGGQMG